MTGDFLGFPRPAEKKSTGSWGVLAPALIPDASDPVRTGLRRVYDGVCSVGAEWRAAIRFAVSESGPGCGTKTASR